MHAPGRKGNHGGWCAAVCCVAVVGFLSAGAMCISQETATGGDAAFAACASDMEHVTVTAYESCGKYVRDAGTGNSANLEQARDWLQTHAVYRAYVRYLKSLTANQNVSFVVYRPDTTIELPEVDQADGFGSIKMQRKFANPTEEAMLREAEAVYPPPAEMIHELFIYWAGWPFPTSGEMKPYWGTPSGSERGGDEVRTVTSSAVRYYYELALGYRKDQKIGPQPNATWTALRYESSIRSVDRYEHAGRSFENVYVVDASLDWNFVCGGLCGHAIRRNKVVVLDKNGEVVALYRDAPENSEYTFY